MAVEAKPKKAGLAIALLLGKPKGSPGGGDEGKADAEESGEDDREQGLTLTRELLDALRDASGSSDPSDEQVEAVYDAFHALSMHCDALPHKEGPHEDEEDEEESPTSERY